MQVLWRAAADGSVTRCPVRVRVRVGVRVTRCQLCHPNPNPNSNPSSSPSPSLSLSPSPSPSLNNNQADAPQWPARALRTRAPCRASVYGTGDYKHLLYVALRSDAHTEAATPAEPFAEGGT